MWLLVLVTCLCCAAARDFEDKLDRYIIACHSTDFECFRRQYKSLRDNVLLGNQRLGVPPYQHYIFKYGDSGTCIKLAGLELSELSGIQLEKSSREFSWTLELPFKIQQVLNFSANCINPENVQEEGDWYPWSRRLIAYRNAYHNRHLFFIRRPPPTSQYYENQFSNVGAQNGALKKFTGNATIQVTYPYTLRKKKGEVYMVLGDENLDVILDIPDLSNYNKNSAFERNLYELSEWAYSVVQHIDAAQNFALPYTSHFRNVAEILPMRRFFALYPEEEYADLRFKFTEGYLKCIDRFLT